MSDTLSVSVLPNGTKLAKAFLSLDVVSFLKGEINRLALSVERYAKQLTPVATGRLRASISTSPAVLSLKAIVSTNTDYAIFIHEGTKYMRARPFMTTGAALAQASEIQNINIRLDSAFTKEFKTL